MPVWKVVLRPDQDEADLAQGYALAETCEEALALVDHPDGLAFPKHREAPWRASCVGQQSTSPFTLPVFTADHRIRSAPIAVNLGQLGAIANDSNTARNPIRPATTRALFRDDDIEDLTLQLPVSLAVTVAQVDLRCINS